jgi:PAS domain S-box-containing protein
MNTAYSPQFNQRDQAVNQVNIVLIDDERTNLRAMEIILSNLGHNLISFTSGTEAIEFVGQNPSTIALIILDIHMPTIDGFGVAQSIQDLIGDEYIPIIFLTGSATDAELIFQGYQKGAIDYLNRDIHPKVLRSKVHAFVQMYQQSKKIREQAKKLQESNSALSKKIKEHKAALINIRDKEKELRDFFDRAHDLIHSVNCQGHFVYVNQCWLDTLSYTTQEVDNLTFLDIVHPDYHEHCQSVFHALCQGIPQTHIEVLFISKYGKEIYVEGNINCQFEEEKVVATRGIFRDITERKKAENAMIVALAKEKEVAEMQSRFVATASHEFRTPLTSIMSATELLQAYGEKLEAEEHQDYLKEIYESAIIMRNLMNDVLLVSKAEAGKIQFNPQPSPVYQICQEIVDQIQKSIGKMQNINIIQESFDPEKSYNLDNKLLQLILTNLVSNAVKYSPEQTTINLKISEKEGSLVFGVQDNGNGIPFEDQPYIFDSFRRGENTHDIPGTGLGLNIVKYCVELHQGQISFVSEPGIGTCFTVNLPID